MLVTVQKALKFSMPEQAWDLSVEEAALQVAVDLELTEQGSAPAQVMRFGRRGAEFCQMLHRATCPEQVLDLNMVSFREDLDDKEVEQNYAVLRCALSTLKADPCGPADTGRMKLMSDDYIAKVKQGSPSSWSHTLDLLQWLIAFCNHLGAPEFYHPGDLREEAVEAVAARRAKEAAALQEAQRRQQAAAAPPTTPARGRRGAAAPSSPLSSRHRGGYPPALTPGRAGTKRPRDDFRSLPAAKAPRASVGGSGVPKLGRMSVGRNAVVVPAGRQSIGGRALGDRAVNPRVPGAPAATAVPKRGAAAAAGAAEVAELRGKLAAEQDEAKTWKKEAEKSRSMLQTREIVLTSKYDDLVDSIRKVVSDTAGLSTEQLRQAIVDQLP